MTLLWEKGFQKKVFFMHILHFFFFLIQIHYFQMSYSYHTYCNFFVFIFCFLFLSFFFSFFSLFFYSITPFFMRIYLLKSCLVLKLPTKSQLFYPKNKKKSPKKTLKKKVFCFFLDFDFWSYSFLFFLGFLPNLVDLL